MKNDYVIQHDEKSFCPDCDKSVDLLVREDGSGPMFYICWPCKKVARVGFGPVKRENS